jgi:hypothetical protein
MSDRTMEALIYSLVPSLTTIVMYVLGQYFNEKRQMHTDRKIAANTDITKDTNNLVNGQREILLQEIADLKQRLK